jgi:DNA-binding winged helix-turn-helix (wHTH) protein/predicted ATPase
MMYLFDDYTLHTHLYELHHAGTPCPMEPQVLDILLYLIQHRDRVVSRQELLDHIWPERFISETSLDHRLMQVRQAIGDNGQKQCRIKTLRGRGYRFVATVEERPVSENQAWHRTAPQPQGLTEVALAACTSGAGRSGWARAPAGALVAKCVPNNIDFPTCRVEDVWSTTPWQCCKRVRLNIVGRHAELTQLHQWYTSALQGAPQIVFVAGEAGIGKTTLVDAFLAQIGVTEPAWIGRGQCVEQHGTGEAYMPLLEALGQVGRSTQGSRLVQVLYQQAPSWLLHLPGLVPLEASEALQRRAGGSTRERMLRELAEAVEAVTAEQLLVLVLEDLHWSDGSTLDWLAYVARRRAVARLLVVGTYRPAEALVRAHPLCTVIRELQMHGQCVELGLDYFSTAEVAAYLAQRFARAALPDGLDRVLYQRTNGNPLFLTTLVEALVQQGVLRDGETGWSLPGGLATVAVGVPENLQQLLARHLEQLPPEERTLLEAASVMGKEFAVAAVAAAVDWTVEEVEIRCAALVRRGQFVQTCGTDAWPDGTVATRYRFIHDVYRETLYEQVPLGRRGRWHLQIGLRLEVGYGMRGREVTVELAEHFVRGRDAARAVQYLHYAGEQAVQRLAHQEALQHLTRALELLATLPEPPTQVQQELDLRITLGQVLIATKGYTAPEVEQTYARARALCAQLGETPRLFPTLGGLCLFYQSRGALATARELGEQLDRLAQRTTTPVPRLVAHGTLGAILFFLGDYTAARTHLEQGVALTDPTAQCPQVLRHGEAPGVRCLAVAALTLWCLGYPEQALQRSQEALAQAFADPYSLVHAQHWAASLHHRRREAAAVQAQAEALLRLARAQGFPVYVEHGICWRGWALALQGQDAVGVALLRQGLAAIEATGLELSRPLWLVLLAEAMGHAGQGTAGLRLLSEVLTALHASGRGDMLAEAYRVQGVLLLQQTTPDVVQAEACLQQALAIARRQQARSWELRAAMDLCRLWRCQGKRAAALQLLAPVYDWFTEGFDTADLQEARTLLDALAGSR